MFESLVQNSIIKYLIAGASEASETGKISFDLSAGFTEQAISITIVGYLVVFIALIVLFASIAVFTNAMISKQKKKIEATGQKAPDKREDIEMTGDVNAAIALALHLHFDEAHDFESTVLTIEKVQKRYSPWSSKIYSMRRSPRHY
jgi:Na+-transporting methylmalonyl-CoA/oxaloacetate decarboxylase gamma subunit